MKLLKGVDDFFSIDIGTNAVRVVQLKENQGKYVLLHHAYSPVDAQIVSASSEESMRKLSEIIMATVGQSGIKTKNVVVGIPSQKSYTTVTDMPLMPESELNTTIKYQIDKYIPTATGEAKADWVSLGVSPNDPQKQEILIASTAKLYSEERLEMIENLGFNVVAMEPDPIAMVRSLLPAGTPDAHIILDVGEVSTNLVVTFADTPRLVRTIPMGLQSLIKSAVQNLNVQEDQARQFILKFGLAQDKLDGQVFKALESTLDGFVAEISKSMKFFQGKYPNTKMGIMYLTGYASTVPQFSDYLSNKSGVTAQSANPWQLVSVTEADQPKIMPVANEYAVAIGLAMRKGSV